MKGQRTFIAGVRYIFEVVEDNGAFKVLAIQNESRRCSSICNMNGMLGNLGVNYQGGRGSGRFEDSSWTVTPEGARRLYERAVEMLSDNDFRSEIESKCDADRSAGEWENVI